MTCSICIATYKRPELLKELLASLYAQDLDEGVNLEIIVVDNDTEESARSICSGFSNTNRISLYYLTQPEKNISLTRNMAVKKATGEYILFADDDVVAIPKWVQYHINTMEKFNADIVIGRAISDFEVEVPEYIKNQGVFNTPCAETGSPVIRLYTGNSALRAKLIRDMDEPFDPALGIMGGEDGKLFQTLILDGAKAVCCFEAVVAELIPKESSTLKWILNRSFRQGYMHTFNRIKLTRNEHKLLFRIYLAGKAMTFGTLSTTLILLTFFNRTQTVHWMTKINSNFGHFLAAIGYRHKNIQ
jgi:succinoglycan biosynthesis protein ExoM